MGGLVVNAGMQVLVIVTIKIVSYAGLHVGQVGKNRPLAEFEHLRFEVWPEALGLGFIVAVADGAAPAALSGSRGQRLVVVEQFAVHVTAVLPAAVGVHEQAWRGRLGPKIPL